MWARGNNRKVVSIAQMFVSKWRFTCRSRRGCLNSPLLGLWRCKHFCDWSASNQWGPFDQNPPIQRATNFHCGDFAEFVAFTGRLAVVKMLWNVSNKYCDQLLSYAKRVDCNGAFALKLEMKSTFVHGNFFSCSTKTCCLEIYFITVPFSRDS